MSNYLLLTRPGLLRGVCLAATLTLVSNAPETFAQGVVPLDAFSDSQGPVTQTGVGASPTNAKDIGGGVSRIISVEVYSVQNPSVGNQISASVGGGQFSHSQDSGVSGVSITQWQNVGRFDWTGFTGLVLEIVSSDLGGPITIVLEDRPLITSNLAGLTKTIPGGISPPGTTLVEFPFSSFLGIRNVDLSNIENVYMLVDGRNVADWDLRVESIGLREGVVEPVPAMTTAGLIGALLGIPLVSVYLAKRRRKV